VWRWSPARLSARAARDTSAAPTPTAWSRSARRWSGSSASSRGGGSRWPGARRAPAPARERPSPGEAMKGRSLLFTLPLCPTAGAPLPAARADQLIQIPTADRVSAPTFEYLQRVDGQDEGYGTVLAPAGRA